MKRTYLGEFEEIVLLTSAVLAIQNQAYGVAITHEISEETGRPVRLNQVHAALQRLEDKGMVKSQMGDPTPERGGRRKRLFTVTAFGQRTKEIGIRKVLGASVSSIVTLLSTDFLKLVLIAIVIATPLAWYAMSQWLQKFAYKIDLTWWLSAIAGLLSVSIALLTVGFQSIRAALMNPAKSLKSE